MGILENIGIVLKEIEILQRILSAENLAVTYFEDFLI